MPAEPTRGFLVEVDREKTNIGTKWDTPLVVRLEEAPEFPSTPKQMEKQANLHDHPAITSDEPLYLETVQEGAIKLSVKPRLAAGAGKMPPIMQFLQSGGWGLTKGTAVSTLIKDVTGYAGDTEIVIEEDLGLQIGDVILIETPTVDGVVKGKDGGTGVGNKCHFAVIADLINVAIPYSDTITLGMKLPTAPIDDCTVWPCYTAIPLWDALDTTGDPSDLLQIRYNTRGKQSAGDDLSFLAIGCATSGLDAITFESGMALPNFPFSFHAADIDIETDALVAGTAQDCPKLNVFASVDFGFATANTSGGIASASKKIISVTWTPPIATVPIPAEGDDSGILNSCQGYMADPEDTGMLEVTFLQEKTLMDECYELNSDANEMKYVHVSVPTLFSNVTTVPGLAIFLPQCRQTEQAVVDFSDKFAKVICKFTPSAAKYKTDTGLAAREMAPVYFAMQHPYAT